MTRVVAHDLRNPIGAIVSAAAMMTGNDNRGMDSANIWTLVQTAGENALTLVNDLLKVKVKELNREPVDLDALIHYCAELLQHKIGAKGQHLEVRSVPLTLPLHQESMWRVIANLLGNASKFSPGGSTIILSLEEMDGGALILVKDHGIGIPEVMKTKIFEVVAEAQREGTAGKAETGQTEWDRPLTLT